MWVIYKKEIRSFLSSLTAFIVMVVFLIITGLLMWVFGGNTVFDLGISSMVVMFNLAPYVFIFLVSAVTMRSFSEEKRLGTLETLSTRPISDLGVILGKYFANVTLVIFALLPTLIYYYSISELGDPTGNIDTGAMWGSYFGLILLGAAYTSIGMFASAITENQIVALILSMLICLVSYEVLGMVGEIKALEGIGKSIHWFGLDFHYYSLSRGVLDTRDLVYFISFSGLFIWITKLVYESRKW
ncbi:MAG: gliding motility-associated ABC transporter permease subunit GldF [Bacteroidetes bacterium]|nr:gliding motility-associated ABC transporter permease subunit GldF [Bacteroidota bacterium]